MDRINFALHVLHIRGKELKEEWLLAFLIPYSRYFCVFLGEPLSAGYKIGSRFYITIFFRK